MTAGAQAPEAKRGRTTGERHGRRDPAIHTQRDTAGNGSTRRSNRNRHAGGCSVSDAGRTNRGRCGEGALLEKGEGGERRGRAANDHRGVVNRSRHIHPRPVLVVEQLRSLREGDPRVVDADCHRARESRGAGYVVVNAGISELEPGRRRGARRSDSQAGSARLRDLAEVQSYRTRASGDLCAARLLLADREDGRKFATPAI